MKKAEITKAYIKKWTVESLDLVDVEVLEVMNEGIKVYNSQYGEYVIDPKTSFDFVISPGNYSGKLTYKSWNTEEGTGYIGTWFREFEMELTSKKSFDKDILENILWYMGSCLVKEAEEWECFQCSETLYSEFIEKCGAKDVPVVRGTHYVCTKDLDREEISNFKECVRTEWLSLKKKLGIR